MCCEDAKRDLRNQQRNNNPEILGSSTHRRRDLDVDQRVAFGWPTYRYNLLPPQIILTHIVKTQRARTCQQQHDADDRPDERSACGFIIDQWFMRPVTCVRNCVVRAVGNSAPGRPEEESRELMRLFWRYQNIGRERVGVT